MLDATPQEYPQSATDTQEPTVQPTQAELIAEAEAVVTAGFSIVALKAGKRPAFKKTAGVDPALLTRESLAKITAGESTGFRLQLGDGSLMLHNGAPVAWLAFEIEGPTKATEEVRDDLELALEAVDAQEAFNRAKEGWWEQTGGGGFRTFFAVPAGAAKDVKELKTTLQAVAAKRDTHVVAELLFRDAIAAPTHGDVHPDKQPYIRLQGGPETAATLSHDEVRALSAALAVTGDEPEDGGESQRVGLRNSNRYTDRVAAHYNRREEAATATLAHLVADGCIIRGGSLPDQVRLKRPGGSSKGHTLTVGGDKRMTGGAMVFADTYPALPVGYHTGFDVYARLHHKGDAKAAAAQLVKDRVVVLDSGELPVVVPSAAQSTPALAREIVELMVGARRKDGATRLIVHAASDFGDVMAYVIRHDDGTISRFHKATEEMLLEFITVGGSETKEGTAHRLPPTVVSMVADHLSRCDDLPFVQQIATEPVVTLSGKILRESGLYLADRVLVSIPRNQQARWAEEYDIPEEPTQADAQASVDYLRDELFADFPFTSAADEATAFAMLLSIGTRPMVDLAPSWAVTATDSGTGKGKLVRVCRMIGKGTPRSIEVSPKQGKADETEKKLTAGALRLGSDQIGVDELAPLDTVTNLTLVSVAAAEHGILQYRILGGNDLATVPGFVLTITANNFVPSGDWPRRLYEVGLRVRRGIASRRDTFRHEDLLGWVTQNRPRLLAHVHTILAVGIRNPNPSLRPDGSFVQWSRLVLNALSWVNIDGQQASHLIQSGRADWLATGDDDRQSWTEFAYWTWKRTTKVGQWLEAAELVRALDQTADTQKPDLPDPVADAILGREYASASSKGVSLGKLLRGIVGTALVLPTGEGEEEVILRFEAKSNGKKAKRYSIDVEGPVEAFEQRIAGAAQVAPVINISATGFNPVNPAAATAVGF